MTDPVRAKGKGLKADLAALRPLATRDGPTITVPAASVLQLVDELESLPDFFADELSAILKGEG